MTEQGRDRLRELLDAVLDEDHQNLTEMAGGAYSSPYHFTRRLTRDAGEPPVAMRRRVMLERAAWQMRHGMSVTDAAFEAGYESVEGFGRAFARAFGHPPSALPTETSHWLPAPNGIHFHPPVSLWVHSKEQAMSPLTEQLVQHDLDDTRVLLDLAKQLPDEHYRAQRLPGHHVTSWDGEEASVGDRARTHRSSPRRSGSRRSRARTSPLLAATIPPRSSPGTRTSRRGGWATSAISNAAAAGTTG